MFNFINCRTWKNQYYPFKKHTIEIMPGLNVHIDNTQDVKYWTDNKKMFLEGIATDTDGITYDIYISCPGQEKSLVANYGKEEAVKIGNSYLDLQIKSKDPNEFKFCCELYRAVQNARLTSRT